MLPPSIGKVDGLTPVPRVRKIRKYQDENKEDTEYSEQDSTLNEDLPDCAEEDEKPSDSEDDQYPHIDDYV